MTHSVCGCRELRTRQTFPWNPRPTWSLLGVVIAYDLHVMLQWPATHDGIHRHTASWHLAWRNDLAETAERRLLKVMPAVPSTSE